MSRLICLITTSLLFLSSLILATAIFAIVLLQKPRTKNAKTQSIHFTTKIYHQKERERKKHHLEDLKPLRKREIPISRAFLQCLEAALLTVIFSPSFIGFFLLLQNKENRKKNAIQRNGRIENEIIYF